MAIILLCNKAVVARVAPEEVKKLGFFNFTKISPLLFLRLFQEFILTKRLRLSCKTEIGTLLF